MTDRIVDRLRTKIDEIRVRGIVPTVRARVEEIVTDIRERIESRETLTREVGSSPEVKRTGKGL